MDIPGTRLNNSFLGGVYFLDIGWDTQTGSALILLISEIIEDSGQTGMENAMTLPRYGLMIKIGTNTKMTAQKQQTKTAQIFVRTTIFLAMITLLVISFIK